MSARDFLQKLVQAREAGAAMVLSLVDAKSALEDAQHTDLLWSGARRQRAAALFGLKEGDAMIASLRAAVAGEPSTFDGIAIQVRA